MAHQESWDPKPNAPIEYRGEMQSIKTKLDGVYINETLKQTAQITDKIVICRSLTHGEAAHERGLGRQPRVRRPQQPAALRLHPQPADDIRRSRLSLLVVLAVQPRGRPGQ